MVDQENPILSCQDIAAQAPPGDAGTIVNYPIPSVLDKCPMTSVVCTPPPGSYFPCGETLVNCIARDMSGNLSECPFVVTVNCAPSASYCDSAEIICNEEVDLIYIMDNSGSISTSEFNAMVSITQNAITDIAAVYPNAQFAVVHYGGDFGDKIFIEHDFTNASTAATINRQGAGSLPGGGPLGGYGDDFHASLDAVIDALNGVGNTNTKIKSSLKNLNKRAGSKFYLLSFTDASPGLSPIGISGSAMKGSTALPFRNVNILKRSPFFGKFTMVHFD